MPIVRGTVAITSASAEAESDGFAIVNATDLVASMLPALSAERYSIA